MALGRYSHVNADGVAYDPTSAEGQKAGLPLANGFKGLVVAATGDLEFIASGYGLAKPRSGGKGFLKQLYFRGSLATRKAPQCYFTLTNHLDSRPLNSSMMSCPYQVILAPSVDVTTLPYVHGQISGPDVKSSKW